MDWTTITTILSIIAGSSTFITIILYRRQQKRFKTAEAFEKEVVALKTTVEVMQHQLTFYDGRLSEMQKLVVGKDAYISQLSKDKTTLEIKNSKNKSAMNRAYSCHYAPETGECPVIKQRMKNDELYLRQLNKEGKNLDGTPLTELIREANMVDGDLG